MDTALNVIVFAGVVATVFGLSYWAYRARHDRSAYVGLYLLFGIPGVLLVVAGLAAFLAEARLGAVLLVIGLGLGLPLLKPVRRAVAAVTPLDPDSPVDMVGLCVLLATLAVLSLSGPLASGSTDAPDRVASPGVTDLVVQVMAEVALAYAAVGFWFVRGFRPATARLGLNRPTRRTILIALGFVVLGYVVSITASLLTQVFQPHVYDQISGVSKQLTSQVQNPAGALVLGVSAGVGEELLFRGALQPRFGIVLTAVAFALLHTGQYGFSFVVLGLFGIGVLLGIERSRYGTTAAIITHAIFDILAVLAQTYG